MSTAPAARAPAVGDWVRIPHGTGRYLVGRVAEIRIRRLPADPHNPAGDSAAVPLYVLYRADAGWISGIPGPAERLDRTMPNQIAAARRLLRARIP